ncbi:carboxypeptidase-like regulatory domain-containing protein [Flagellimonas sp. S3867]|uniref:carboxypeptidase-like regulatory domain-containing protein n=1 Tax=Flagellimonas sp. S3867 TaxID=2768063 RepID=UPI00168A0188|nr:carboxypeptidase-like regulatory domain-containing protein [Flagellimonas sp. S3867]
MKNIKNNLVLFLFLLGYSAISQTLISGKIVDRHSGDAVDFANIGIVAKNKGTVSDFDGSFKISLLDADINQQDTLQISRIGFTTKKFSTKDFLEKMNSNPILLLESVAFELEGIVVKSSDAEKRRIGYQSRSKRLFGFWNDSLALGGEHASKIMVRRGPLKLEDISFNVMANISDSLLVRVNVYELEKGLPGKNISRANILHTIKQRQGTISINLSPYNIVVDEHFVISLELLKIYGGKVGIGISAYDDGARSYTRVASQGKWRRMRKGFTIAFHLNTSLVDANDPVTNIATLKNRENPNEISLLWDTSRSMEKRDFDNEIRFLDAYFNRNKNLKVNFTPFNNQWATARSFEVKNGNWDDLKTVLKSTIHDGGATQSLWHNMEITSHTLLFTDGKNFPSELGKDWEGGPLFIINGNISANHRLLKELSEDHGGNYLNLEKLDSPETAVAFTQYYLKDNLEYRTQRDIQKSSMIKGSVGDLDYPLTNVKVQVRNSDRTARTDSKGNFTIQAFNGEILEFSYPGREKASSVVNTGSKMLKIIMPIGVTALNEVVLEENLKLKELHKPLNKNITTRFGTLDMEKVGFSVKQIDGERLSQTAQTVMEALQGKFPGVKIIRDYNKNIDLVFIRADPLLRFPASWDVDGHIYAPDRPPFHINLHNIKDITIMPAAWSTARYGRLAPGGIIIIRTISNTFDEIGNSQGKKNEAQNKYAYDAIELATGLSSKPLYAQRIAKAKSAEKAYQQYLVERKNYGSLPSFYVESSKIFNDYWRDESTAQLINSNLMEQFPEDVATLKILAYSYEEKGMLADAAHVYRHILGQNNSLQVKRDLARISSKLKKYDDAWTYYKGYVGQRNNFSNKGLDKLVRKEILTFVQKHGDAVGIDKTKFSNETTGDLSLIVEWNDPNAQFELQFVSPEGRYFNWNNAIELSHNEIVEGNLSTVFDIEELQQGQWLVNITYSGNQINLPTYLKFTLTNNRTGEENTQIITLRQRNVKYKVMDITNQGMVFY